MNELVSAVITTRNRVSLLSKAIESVLGQTYTDVELIVVDDGSVDGTRDMCKSYPLHYVYIPPEESRGGNYARNLGVKNARGRYVAFLDDDDEWLPTKIEKQMLLVEEKHCRLVYCLRKYQDVSQGSVVKTRWEFRPKPSGNLHEIIFRHYITNTSCILAEKQLIEEVGGFDENLRKWQEYDLMIRMAQRTPIFYVDEFLCQYRNDLDDANRISNDFNLVKETISKIRKKYADDIRRLPLKTRLYFYDMCVYDTYKLARKTGRRWHQWRLFLPYILLTLFKTVDDSSIARKNMELLKDKYRSMKLLRIFTGGGKNEVAQPIIVRLHGGYYLNAA